MVNENVVNNELIQQDIINVGWSNINEDNVLPQRTRGVQLNIKEIVPPLDSYVSESNSAHDKRKCLIV